MSKRPWKKFARITRETMNSGDVKFTTFAVDPRNAWVVPAGTHESLDDAERSLDLWFADWWPRQIKKSRRA